MPRYVRVLVVAATLACALGVVGAVPASAAGMNLHRGSHGPNVRSVEARLHQLRLLPASAVDRRYRRPTVRAVRAFQRQQRVSATGRVNARTWNLLVRATTPRLQSFHEALFPRLRALEPALTFVFLIKSPTAPATVKEFGATIAGLNLEGLTASTVADYQRAGLRVWAYTALTTAELKTSWNLRVNGVFTDLPRDARAMFHPGA